MKFLTTTQKHLINLALVINNFLNQAAQKTYKKLPRKLQNKTLLAILAIALFSLFIFWKIPLKGEIPTPGDLLVSFYYPFYNGGFEGYDPWTRHKEFIASDAIRQDIPWRALAIDMFKQGQWPLWNPFNFSGTPLLANLQSAVFYPLNFVFFLLPFMQAWILYVIVQPFLFALFTYLFIRALKLSRAPAFLAALAVAGSSFLIIWVEIGIVGHTILWLPLLLYATEKLHQKLALRHLLIFIFAATASLLSGHFQTAMHTFILVGLYWLFRTFNKFKSKDILRSLGLLTVLFTFVFGLVSLQLLPALELKPLSPLSEEFAKDVFLEIKTPVQNLLTFLAPDIWGNPATNNFSSDIYGDGTPFIGVIPLFFALFAIFAIKKRIVRFWAIVALAYLTYGFPGPLYHLARILPISLFTSTLSSRSLIVVVFSLAVLSAYGLEHFMQKLSSAKNRRLYTKTLLAFTTVYALVWAFFLITPKISSIYQLFPFEPATYSVAKRNLVLPSAVLGSLLLSSWLILSNKKLKTLFFLGLFLPSLVFAYYHYNKTSPSSPPEFFFPKHPLITYNQQNLTPYRTIGFGTAKFDKNFSTYYQIFSPEGYDSLRIRRYAELIASQETGSIPEKYSKSDADFLETENGRRKKILDLTSVKYIHDKNEGDNSKWDPEEYKYPGDSLGMIEQQQEFKLYERFDSLDRAQLVGEYLVKNNSQDILDTIYSTDFDPRQTAILEQPLPDHINLEPSQDAVTTISAYTPNRVTIDTTSPTDQLLVLSDAHYPGWEAYVDSKKTPVYRANYAFRAIHLPAGQHQVEFIYQPKSFKTGLYLSLASLATLTAASFYLVKSKKLGL